MDRKDFFRNSGRWVLLGALGLIAGYFFSNRQVSGQKECPEGAKCGTCRRFSGCTLPKANQVKNNGK